MLRAVIFDVDGVLTDGSIIYTSRGNEIKKFNVMDGFAIKRLRDVGIKTFIISNRRSEVVKKRSKELNIEKTIQGIKNKESTMEGILKEHGLKKETVAYIGDDITDLAAMKKIGIPIAVKNAAPEIKKIAKYVTKKEGGKGAAREAIEYLLKKENKWEKILKNMK